MNLTDYHPVRTALMRGVYDVRASRSGGIESAEADTMVRPMSDWKPRFGHSAAQSAGSGWFPEGQHIDPRETGRLAFMECADAMDRLWIFQDMFASLRRDGRPIIDVTSQFERLSGDPDFVRDPAERLQIDPAFTGSVYVHFGRNPHTVLGGKSQVTGAYVNAEVLPDNGVLGKIHFVGTDPDWPVVHRIPFYETVMEHQQAAVLQYLHKPDGTHLWHMAAEDENFGTEMEAIHLLPYVKLGVDIALRRHPEYEVSVTKEPLISGASAKLEDCRINVAVVSLKMEPVPAEARPRPMGM